MISSMTGFGEVAAEVDGVAYSVELRAVNNRHLKVFVRVPENIQFLNDEIEKTIRGSLSRGTVNCSLRMQNVSPEPEVTIDENLLKGHINKLKQLGRACETDVNIDFATLLTLPGVLVAVEPGEEEAARIRDVVIGLTKKAIENLKQMRVEEGLALADDLMDRCGDLKNMTAKVKELSSSSLEMYNEKLKGRVDELLSSAKLQIDTDLLAREVAVFADRSDISEEITRLYSHLEQFEKTCKSNENAGRRLDFISQELLRETNTIGSKALNAEISTIVIDMKCVIENIKEQVQNVE